MSTYRAAPYLFAEESLGRYLGQQLAKARETIGHWKEDELLQLPDHDVIDYVTSKFAVECPIVHRAGIEALPATDATIRVEAAFHEMVDRRISVRRYAVPYAGDGEVFKYRAVPRSYNSPQAKVKPATADSGEIEFDLQFQYGQTVDPRELEKAVHAVIDKIDGHLAWSAADLNGYNAQLAQIASGVTARKAAILAERELEANLGFPVRGRKDAATYAVPKLQKKIVTRPTVPAGQGTKPFAPEPAMTEAQYEEAIAVLDNGRSSLERSPDTFSRMSETDIRNILLVNLNAQFKGDAAGEVFNGAGKTDILIRVGDKNVFIAECKIWRGQKAITEALDQLLGYLVWRDTKAALLLFIRSGHATGVITKAVAAIEAHPNRKHTTRNGTTGERNDYVFASKEDTAREIQLAFLPFVLPTKG